MALNIKNDVVERLVDDIVAITGETKVQAVRRALEERKVRLEAEAVHEDPWAQAMRFLEREVWPLVPRSELGRRMSRDEEDEILGYGPEGA